MRRNISLGISLGFLSCFVAQGISLPSATVDQERSPKFTVKPFLREFFHAAGFAVSDWTAGIGLASWAKSGKAEDVVFAQKGHVPSIVWIQKGRIVSAELHGKPSKPHKPIKTDADVREAVGRFTKVSKLKVQWTTLRHSDGKDWHGLPVAIATLTRDNGDTVKFTFERSNGVLRKLAGKL